MAAMYLLMIAVGIALVAWGLPASHRLKRPLDIVAALMVLVGISVALLGTLLFMAPNFFKS